MGEKERGRAESKGRRSSFSLAFLRFLTFMQRQHYEEYWGQKLTDFKLPEPVPIAATPRTKKEEKEFEKEGIEESLGEEEKGIIKPIRKRKQTSKSLDEGNNNNNTEEVQVIPLSPPSLLFLSSPLLSHEKIKFLLSFTHL